MSKKTYLASFVAATLVAGLIIVGCTSTPANEAQSSDIEQEAANADANESTVSNSAIYDPAYWANEHPLQYASYLNDENAAHTSEKRTGKSNSLIDVEKGKNPSQTGCLHCHSSQFGAVVDAFGNQLQETDRADIDAIATMGITCYSCHENNPGSVTVANDWIRNALNSGGIEIGENETCAQCHAAVDFDAVKTESDPESWSTLAAGTKAEDVWAWFEAKGNYNPNMTMHIQYNVFQGSIHEQLGLTCADCHMGTKTEGGNTITNHTWQTLENNQNLYETCASCHDDGIDGRMEAIAATQKEFTSKSEEVQASIDTLSAAIEASTDETTSAEAEKLLGKAKFFLAYCTDRTAGFHALGPNGQAAICLPLAQEAADAGLALLG